MDKMNEIVAKNGFKEFHMVPKRGDRITKTTPVWYISDKDDYSCSIYIDNGDIRVGYSARAVRKFQGIRSNTVDGLISELTSIKTMIDEISKLL